MEGGLSSCISGVDVGPSGHQVLDRLGVAVLGRQVEGRHLHGPHEHLQAGPVPNQELDALLKAHGGRGVQRGLAEQLDVVRDRSQLQELLNVVNTVGSDGAMEGTDPVLVKAGVDVGAVFQEDLNPIRVVGHRGAEERGREVVLVENIDVSALLQEELRDVSLSVDRRQVEARPPDLVRCIGVGPEVQELADDVVGAFPSGEQENGIQVAPR